MKRLYFLTFLSLLFTTSHAQETGSSSFNVKSSTVFFPRVYKPGEISMGMGATITKIPYDWVETAINAPVFNYHINMGLPYGFSTTGDVLSLIVSNQFRLGPRWGAEFDKFSFNIGFDAAYMFGYLWFAGFNNKAQGLFTYPNISVGYNFGQTALSLEAEVMAIHWMNMTSGDVKTNVRKFLFTGGSVGVYVEQPIHKKTTFVLGMRMYYTKYYFVAWPAFSTFNHYYFLPELSFAIRL